MIPRARRIPWCPDKGLYASYVPAKRQFLVHANYDALLHFNCAHHYAPAAGIGAERIGAASQGHGQ